jgi:hypothetical protein
LAALIQGPKFPGAHFVAASRSPKLQRYKRLRPDARSEGPRWRTGETSVPSSRRQRSASAWRPRPPGPTLPRYQREGLPPRLKQWRLHKSRRPQSGACGLPLRRAYRPYRRCGRVAEGGGLLNRYRVVKPYRGFESLRLRQSSNRTANATCRRFHARNSSQRC